MLRGRDAELAEVARLVAEARSGRSGVLVVRGEPGIGKSALLDQVVRQATQVRVLRTTGVEAEASLPFAGLQMLLRPVLNRAWAEAGDRPWATAVALRCRVLLSPAEQAGEHYARALRLHLKGGRPFERARTELLYGEWLRRGRRRADARPPLRSALEIFERLGAAPWAERARAELRATGESVPAARPASTDALARLTSQELQIARLAAAGLSNRDIAA
ncbi:AAA family ATPase, partial [Nonomuraea sp. RK-328]|nr:AAA family ATPase [Nonomuraea sp. RK-328]